MQSEKNIFKKTFDLIDAALRKDAFKRYSGNSFSGGTLISAFEAITHGVSINIDKIEAKGSDSLRDTIIAMWSNPEFTDYAKAGVRGSMRLSKILPFASKWFQI